MSKRAIGMALAGLALTSCNSSKLNIRPVTGSPLAATANANERIAMGHTQLAMGNVGFAIESFRKALREDPTNIDAYEGLAIGYERLGRFDLAAKQVESALAMQPDNLVLLERLAANLKAEGLHDKANAVRREIAMRAALGDGEVPAAGAVARAVAIDERLTLVAPVAPTAPLVPAPTKEQPRLVRMSRAEIALVTGPGPLWEKAARAAPPSMRSHQVEMLNAARVNRLAARTRQLALANGWSNVSVGDAPEVRSESIVLYPASARLGAARLAAQLGCKAQLDPSRSHITVLLGRDAARHLARGGAKGA